MTFHSTYMMLDTLTVFLLLLLAVFMAQYKRGKRTANLLLAAALFSYAMAYMDGVFLSLGYYFHKNYPYMIYATMSFDFLVGPLLLLYAKSRTLSQFQLAPRHIGLFIPFVMHFCYLISQFIMTSMAHNIPMVQPQPIFSKAEVYVLTSVSNGFYAVFAILVARQILLYHQNLKKQYSDLTRRNLNWLLLLCGLLFTAALLRYSNNLWWLEAPFHPLHNHLDLKLLAIFCVVVFATTIVFKTMQSAQNLTPALFDETVSPKKYQSSAIEQSNYSEILSKIDEYLNAHKLYTQQDLSIQELADTIDLPVNYVSESINGGLGVNFYEYIASYRILEAEQLLKSPEKQDLPIAHIMELAGFSSKSVFNTKFKQKTGMTPSAYRKYYLANTLQEESAPST